MKAKDGGETITSCKRCGKLCKAGKPNPDARPFRKASEGWCLECCFTRMLRVDDGDNSVLVYAAQSLRPEQLLLPHIQAQFKRLLEVGHSQARYEDIDWQAVIAKWDLPFEMAQKRAKRRAL